MDVLFTDGYADVLRVLPETDSAVWRSHNENRTQSVTVGLQRRHDTM